ncbi:DUF1292 domain-containing protein [Cohnella sp. REN36]|uniref:DUF1292 domain-containing protein n=1 Tax=Cohnella sp. REN36 TaxID=2887347 RepID=UPI001D1513E3|nr:DUF1292 domain-containing protein [Cohnella sp. REN36]MCC3375617.1 DUF1292 domain-containing protein [Cohnella sp. REN36]
MKERANGAGGQPVSALRARYGDEVALTSEGGGDEAFRIVAELTVDGRAYALLQSERMRAEGDIEVFRVTADDAGEPQLETVEDDDEWEAVAEAYDDLQFGSDDRP